MNQELQTATKPKADLVTVFKTNVARQEADFRAALPAHIPVERYTRVLITAVVNNPALLEADRRSLFEAAMKAAQDGLLPDGREGALVIFNAKVKGQNGAKDEWIKKVQWMPMIAGILKKVRNSGELLSIAAHVAYSNDDFSYELGDEERIAHRPALGEERGKPRLVYAIAKTKDGGIYREIMTVADVERVRAISRSKDDGPWVVWWDEMARKTVLRRLSKRLPMSSDLDDLIRRDDQLSDFDAGQSHRISRALAPTPAERLRIDLDALAANGNGNGDPPHDPETGEIIGASTSEFGSGKGPDAPNSDWKPEDDPTGDKAVALLAAQLKERAAAGINNEGANHDDRLGMLLDEGRAAATNGVAAFDKWWKRLGTPDAARITKEHHAAMRKAAAESDARGA